MSQPTPADAADVPQAWPREEFLDYVPLIAGAVLPLLLDWRGWVDRRIETLEFLDEHRIYRHVSLDLTVPKTDQLRELRDECGYLVLPLSLQSKHPLRNFSLRDETGRAIPLLTRTQHEELGIALLTGVARNVGQNGKARRTHLQQSVIDDMEGMVRESDPARAEERVRDFVRHAHDTDQRHQLWSDTIFQTLARDLAVNFPLHCRIDAGVGERRILKYSYEEEFKGQQQESGTWAKPQGPVLSEEMWHDQGNWLEAMFSRCRLKPPRLTVKLPALGNAQSFHVEVQAPDELLIADAVVGTKRDSDGKYQPVRQAHEKGIERTHLNTSDWARGTEGALLVNFSLHPSGVVTAMVLISAIALLLLAAGLVGHLVFHWHRSGDAAPATLLVLPGIFASYLIRPGEHRLVRHLVSGYKWQAAGLTVLSFVAAGSLAVNMDANLRTWLWVACAVAALVSTVASFANYWLANRCRRNRLSR